MTEPIEDADAFVEELKAMSVREGLKKAAKVMRPENSAVAQRNMETLFSSKAFGDWIRLVGGQVSLALDELDQEEDT